MTTTAAAVRDQSMQTIGQMGEHSARRCVTAVGDYISKSALRANLAQRRGLMIWI